ncbi:MAG: DUF6165 family protein [Pseudomonadota bacterium]
MLKHQPSAKTATSSVSDGPVSYGELLDKITILEIKAERIKDAAKLENVRHELELLSKVWDTHVDDANQVTDAREQLRAVNLTLWEIEDKIRLKEAANTFDDRFVELARAVYVTNDRRAAIKKDINLALGSALIEEKSYEPY